MGWYVAPSIHWDEEAGAAEIPILHTSTPVRMAEVEVDMGTGEVTVLNMAAAHDVGRAINPEMLKGQLYGGVMMDWDGASWKKWKLTKAMVLNSNFDNFLMPTSKDMPTDHPYHRREIPIPTDRTVVKSIGEPTLEL